MPELEQGQRCRVEYRENKAQRALTDHKATDRLVDLASKSPDERCAGGIQLSITATIFFQS